MNLLWLVEINYNTYRRQVVQLICSDINVNAKEYWKDLIEITFVAENKEYLSIARIIYDESVYIEYNDQVNFIKAR